MNRAFGSTPSCATSRFQDGNENDEFGSGDTQVHIRNENQSARKKEKNMYRNASHSWKQN
jgi:hypothetical protein